MNTTELIIEVARRTQSTHIRMTRKEVAHVVDLLLDVLREELAKPGGEIHLRQFGVFSVVEARMPGGTLLAGSDERRLVEAGNTYCRVRFRPSRFLMKSLRGND